MFPDIPGGCSNPLLNNGLVVDEVMIGVSSALMGDTRKAEVSTEGEMFDTENEV